MVRLSDEGEVNRMNNKIEINISSNKIVAQSPFISRA